MKGGTQRRPTKGFIPFMMAQAAALGASLEAIPKEREFFKAAFTRGHSRSRYKPHQNEQEKSRRRRQMAAGIIHP